MADTVEDKVEPWVEAADEALEVEGLEIDVDRVHGQIRRQDPQGVEAKYQQLVQNPPMGLVK